MDRGSAIHKLGEDYLKAPKKPRNVPKEYEYFKGQMDQLFSLKPRVELQLGFTDKWTPATASTRDPTGWFAKDTWLRIVCDVDVRYEDNTADIIDFKTGKIYETNEEQVELFSTAPFMEDSSITAVTTRLWYLDQPKNNEIIREYTRKDYELIKKDWAKRVKPMFVDKRFAPRPNQKCGWCHFRKANGGPCQY